VRLKLSNQGTRTDLPVYNINKLKRGGTEPRISPHCARVVGVDYYFLAVLPITAAAAPHLEQFRRPAIVALSARRISAPLNQPKRPV